MGNKILVVDDQKFIRDLFSKILEVEGYNYDVAESGEEAVRLVGSGEYGLVFLDLNMPGIDGVTTLRLIREFDDETPVYITTGFYFEYMRPLKKIAREGLNFELLEKPIDRTKIRAVAENVLNCKTMSC